MAGNVGTAISDIAKRAAISVAPAAQGVTAVASAVLPGTGEILTGKYVQGGCTLAAFLSATAAAAGVTAAGAAVLATPAGMVIVAAPVAIRVLSAWQGARAGQQVGTHLQISLMNERVNESEGNEVAEQALRAAETMPDAEFERLVLEHEEAEMLIAETTQPRIALKRIRPPA